MSKPLEVKFKGDNAVFPKGFRKKLHLPEDETLYVIYRNGIRELITMEEIIEALGDDAVKQRREGKTKNIEDLATDALLFSSG